MLPRPRLFFLLFLACAAAATNPHAINSEPESGADVSFDVLASSTRLLYEANTGQGTPLRLWTTDLATESAPRAVSLDGVGAGSDILAFKTCGSLVLYTEREAPGPVKLMCVDLRSESATPWQVSPRLSASMAAGVSDFAWNAVCSRIFFVFDLTVPYQMALFVRPVDPSSVSRQLSAVGQSVTFFSRAPFSNDAVLLVNSPTGRKMYLAPSLDTSAESTLLIDSAESADSLTFPAGAFMGPPRASAPLSYAVGSLVAHFGTADATWVELRVAIVNSDSYSVSAWRTVGGPYPDGTQVIQAEVTEDGESLLWKQKNSTAGTAELWLSGVDENAPTHLISSPGQHVLGYAHSVNAIAYHTVTGVYVRSLPANPLEQSRRVSRESDVSWAFVHSFSLDVRNRYVLFTGVFEKELQVDLYALDMNTGDVVHHSPQLRAGDVAKNAVVLHDDATGSPLADAGGAIVLYVLHSVGADSRGGQLWASPISGNAPPLVASAADLVVTSVLAVPADSSFVYRAFLPIEQGPEAKLFHDRITSSDFVYTTQAISTTTPEPTATELPVTPAPVSVQTAASVVCSTHLAKLARACLPSEPCSKGADGAEWTNAAQAGDGFVFTYASVALDSSKATSARPLYLSNFGWDEVIPIDATIMSLTVRARYWNSDGGVYVPNNGLTLVRDADGPDVYGDIFEEDENAAVRMVLDSVIQDGAPFGSEGWRHGLPTTAEMRRPEFGVSLLLRHDGLVQGPVVSYAVISEVEMTTCYAPNQVNLQPVGGQLGLVLPPSQGLSIFEWFSPILKQSVIYAVDLLTLRRLTITNTGALQQFERCNDLLFALTKVEDAHDAPETCCCVGVLPSHDFPCVNMSAAECGQSGVCVDGSREGGVLYMVDLNTVTITTLLPRGGESFAVRSDCTEVAVVTTLAPQFPSAHFIIPTLYAGATQGRLIKTSPQEEQIVWANGHVYSSGPTRTRLAVDQPYELFVSFLELPSRRLMCEYTVTGEIIEIHAGPVQEYQVFGSSILFVAAANSTGDELALYSSLLPPGIVERISPVFQAEQAPLTLFMSPDLRFAVFHGQSTPIFAVETSSKQSLTILWDNPGPHDVIICPTSTHAVFAGPFVLDEGQSLYSAALDGSSARLDPKRHPELKLNVPVGFKVEEMTCTSSGDRVIFRARLGMEQQLWMTSVVDPSAPPIRIGSTTDVREDVFYLTQRDQFLLYAEGDNLRLTPLPEFPHQAPENTKLLTRAVPLTASLGGGEVLDYQQISEHSVALLWRRVAADARQALYALHIEGSAPLVRLSAQNHSVIVDFSVCDTGLFVAYRTPDDNLYVTALAGGSPVLLASGVERYAFNAACSDVATLGRSGALARTFVGDQSTRAIAQQATHFGWSSDGSLVYENDANVRQFVASPDGLWFASVSDSSLIVRGPQEHRVWDGGVQSALFSPSSPMLYFTVSLDGASGDIYGFALSDNTGATAVKLNSEPEALPVQLSTASSWVVSGSRLALAYNEVPLKELLPSASARTRVLTPSAKRVVFEMRGKIFSIPVEGPVSVPLELDTFVKSFGATTDAELLAVSGDSATALFFVRQSVFSPAPRQLWVSGTSGTTYAMRLSDIHSVSGGVASYVLTRDSSRALYVAFDSNECPTCQGLYAVDMPEGIDAPADGDFRTCNNDGVCGPLEDCMSCSADCHVLPSACCSGSYSAGCLPSSGAFPSCQALCSEPPSLGRPCPDVELSSAPVSAWGDLSFDENVFAGTCDPFPAEGGDETFAFVASETGTHVVTLHSFGGVTLLLYARNETCSGAELACIVAQNVSTTLALSLSRGQRVFLIVDALRVGDQSAFELTVTEPGGIPPSSTATIPCQVGGVTVPCAPDGSPLINKRETVQLATLKPGNAWTFGPRGQLSARESLTVTGGEIRFLGAFEPGSYILLQAPALVTDSLRFGNNTFCALMAEQQPLNTLEVVVPRSCDTPGLDFSVAGVVIGTLIVLALMVVAGLLLRRYLLRAPLVPRKRNEVARPAVPLGREEYQAPVRQPTLEDINLEDYELRVITDDTDFD